MVTEEKVMVTEEKVMVTEETGNGRVRAWVLVEAKSAQQVAEGLYDKLGHEGDDSFVVVRADVVDFDYNIVIPVDAESENVLSDVVEQIRGMDGVNETVIVRIKEHVPYPPHDAHGYITAQEAEAGQETVEPGRQGASPGFNPFG